MGAGVNVYGYEQGMMHAKALAIDNEWAMLGTANLDNRSMFLNYEQMAVFDRAEDVREIQTELARLVSASHQHSLDELARRPWQERLLASFARLFAPLL